MCNKFSVEEEGIIMNKEEHTQEISNTWLMSMFKGCQRGTQ